MGYDHLLGRRYSMKKRLVTRSDFDGLVCAMLLKELDMIDEIKFVHPKDVQDGKIDITENDITTNLPFDPRVGIARLHVLYMIITEARRSSPAYPTRSCGL